MYEEGEIGFAEIPLWIAIGGSLGSLGGWYIGLGQRLQAVWDQGIPYGTFVINITACVIIGFTLAFLGRRTGLNPAWKFPRFPLVSWAHIARSPPLSGRLSRTVQTGSLFQSPDCTVVLSVVARSCGCLVRSPDCGSYAMRANKMMNYTSVLQVRGESVCPFCRFLKDFQAALLFSLAGENTDPSSL